MDTMHKNIFITAALGLLAGCASTTSGVSTAYVVAADSQGGADTLYIAAEKAGEALVATSVITPQAFGLAADKAYVKLVALRKVLAAVRAASIAGTDTSVVNVAVALADFNSALADLQTLAGVAVTPATAN